MQQLSKLNAPVYDQVDGLLFIGIHHRHLLQEDEPHIELFESRVRSLDHLAMEGYSELTRMRSLVGIHYETVAAATFSGEITYLDDREFRELDQRIVELGLHPDLGVVSGLYRDAIVAQATSSVPMDGIAALISMVLTKKVIHPRWNVDLERVTSTIPALYVDMSENQRHKLLLGAVNAIDQYDAMVRDHLCYAPQLKTFRECAGVKGVVIGALHIEPLKQLLAGNASPLPTWQQYVAALDEDTQYGIHVFEELAREHFGTTFDTSDSK